MVSSSTLGNTRCVARSASSATPRHSTSQAGRTYKTGGQTYCVSTNRSFGDLASQAGTSYIRLPPSHPALWCLRSSLTFQSISGTLVLCHLLWVDIARADNYWHSASPIVSRQSRRVVPFQSLATSPALFYVCGWFPFVSFVRLLGRSLRATFVFTDASYFLGPVFFAKTFVFYFELSTSWLDVCTFLFCILSIVLSQLMCLSPQLRYCLRWMRTW
jgi:hypothetical protein